MIRMRRFLHWIWLGSLLGILAQYTSCLQAETTTTTQLEMPEESGVRMLVRSYRKAGKLLLVFGTSDPLFIQEYQQIAREFSQISRRTPIEVYQADQISEDTLSKYPVFLIGTPQGNPWITQFEQQLPLEIDADELHFHRKTYTGDAYIFQLSFFPHPLNTAMPIGLVTGNSDEEVLNHLQSMLQGRQSRRRGLWANWGFQLFEDSKRIVMGAFNEKWEVESDQYWDFQGGDKPLATTEHFQIFDHQVNLSGSACRRLEDRLEENFEKVQAFLGEKGQNVAIPYHVYKSSELMGLMRSRQVQGYVDLEKGAVHLIHNDYYEGNIVEPQNHLILRHFIGTPRKLILETGMCNLLTEKWQKHGALYWAARLAASNNHVPLSELFAAKAPEGASYLVRGAMAGALVQFLMEEWGKDSLLTRYTTWTPSDSELKSMEKAWQQWLNHLPDKYPSKSRSSSIISYYRGMTFAHEGYNIHDGYGSSLGRESLEKISNLNSNAIAIVPYSGTREVYKPVPFRINQWAGGENDAAVVATYQMAKELGMQTLLKPQIWFPGAWPGEVEMKNKQDWKLFFQHYRRWIRHYAMLAEIHEMDMFCVGVEFAKATVQHPEEWRSLIRDMRQIYQGPITYAANWGEEFEKLAFGDELDVIGVDNYYPLSKRDKPSDKVLEEGFEDVKKTLKKVHKKFNKPIIFTEVGFRSIEAPWKQPHEEAGDASFSSIDQARCYRVILEGIQGEDWCRGLFWWKWPSYMQYRGEQNRSFSPCGKEAQEVLKQAYAKLK